MRCIEACNMNELYYFEIGKHKIMFKRKSRIDNKNVQRLNNFAPHRENLNPATE